MVNGVTLPAAEHRMQANPPSEHPGPLHGRTTVQLGFAPRRDAHSPQRFKPRAKSAMMPTAVAATGPHEPLGARKSNGEMAERFKAPVLKTGVVAIPPWVRIPLSPPTTPGVGDAVSTAAVFAPKRG